MLATKLEPPVPRLTDAFLKALVVEPGKRDRMAFDDACPGLGVRATAKGTKAFIVQWTDPISAKKQREPLGVWPTLSLDAARNAAKIKLGEVAAGRNPRAERLAARAEAARREEEELLTLDRLISDWARLHLASRKPTYALEAQRSLRAAFSSFLKAPAARLTKSQVINQLDEISQQGKATSAARTLGCGRAAFNWALKRGKIEHNPFSNLPISTRSKQRERALSPAEVREVWGAAGTLNAPTAQFFRMALLTLARRDEVAKMSWSEISLERREWTIPSSRSKNSKAHTIHLSDPALELLASVPRLKGQEFVFSFNGTSPISGFSTMKRRLDAAIERQRAETARKKAKELTPFAPFVLHDFRRSGVSALAEMGFDSIVADKLLNHQPAKLLGVAGVYQRYDFAKERARALDFWGSLCAGGDEHAADNVISIAAAR